MGEKEKKGERRSERGIDMEKGERRRRRVRREEVGIVVGNGEKEGDGEVG